MLSVCLHKPVTFPFSTNIPFTLIHLLLLILDNDIHQLNLLVITYICRGGFKGGAHPARAPPPKIGKNMIFHTKYPQHFRSAPLF